MEILILAGGLGTRLRTEVSNLPKVLAPINGRPFLDIIIEQISKAHNNSKIHFALGYLSELIVDHLKNFHPNLNYSISVEKELLGTGGAIKQCLNFFKEENIIVINGDTFFDLDLNKLCNFHVLNYSDCTVAVKKMYNVDRYGSIKFDKISFMVTEFIEKKYIENGYINGGYIVFNRTKLFSKLAEVKQSIFSLEDIIFNSNQEDYKILAYPLESTFIDIGIPEDFNKAQELFK